MIADSERREAAERLRDVARAEGGPLGDIGFTEAMHRALVGGDWRDMTERLADLIEPEPERTCRVKSSHEVEGDGCYAYFEYKLTCGHDIAWGDQLPPSYCPECGRRVLYDSNDYI